MKLAFKYRFYPTEEQADMLARTFGCVRYVYNFGLAMRKDAYETDKTRVSFGETSAALTKLKRQEETLWLRDVCRVPLQQALRHLDRAFTNFFNSHKNGNAFGYPNFKKRHNRQSATYTRGAFNFSTESGLPVLKLAKMKHPLRVRWSRIPPSAPSTVTVSRDPAGRYFVSLVCEVGPQFLSPKTTAIGIDLGITDLVVTSDGFKSGNPKFLENDIRHLGHEQKTLSRKQRGSNNWEKQRLKVARLHARIADRRRDYLQKMSTRLIRENQAIYLEDINIKEAMQTRYLAQAIGSASWGEVVRMLEYKGELYGRSVVKIERDYPSSQICSICNHQNEELKLGKRKWACECCGITHDRDINAAKNILAAGQAVSADSQRNASGGNVRPGSTSVEAGSPGERGIP